MCQRILTRKGPEALRRLDKDVLQEAREAVAYQLGPDTGKDGQSRILQWSMSHCTPMFDMQTYQMVVVVH